MMTEAEQLAILQRIPGFIRPSEAWLKGLAVGDRVMFNWFYDLQYRSSHIYIVQSVGSLISLRSEDPAYGKKAAQRRGWNLLKQGKGKGYWISPIEPQAEQQEALRTRVEQLVEKGADLLFDRINSLTKDLHQIAEQLGIPTDDRAVMMGAIARRLDELLATEQDHLATMPVKYGDARS